MDALAKLVVTSQAGASPLAKAIASALANATQKQADGGALKFKTIEIMGGPAMKRFRAVSRGQAHSYKKRMTHIRVILTDEGGKK
jgi:large subunit ribosomal protein L22